MFKWNQPGPLETSLSNLNASILQRLEELHLSCKDDANPSDDLRGSNRQQLYWINQILPLVNFEFLQYKSILET